MDNPQKLETQGTQDEDKQSKIITQYVPDTTTRKQTQTRYEPSYKQDMSPPTNNRRQDEQTRYEPSNKQDMSPPTNKI